MGCDIHLHTEVKIAGNWHHYSAPSVRRDYRIFGLMAGVRNPEVGAIADPRGLPLDASVVTMLDYFYWAADAHSMSWLNAKEIRELARLGAEYVHSETYQPGSLYWLCDYVGYLFGNSYFGFVDRSENYPTALEDVRFIFWFDN